jgi:hypothetical protein
MFSQTSTIKQKQCKLGKEESKDTQSKEERKVSRMDGY